MKKLMIALAAVAMAAGVQAAAVNWKSGNLNGAATAAGGWSDTVISKTATAGVVTMNIYQIAAADWTADGIAKMSQQELYSYVATKGLDVWYSGQNLNSKSALIPGVTVSTDDLAANKAYYTIVTADYTDTSLGKMYMAAASTFETSAQGEASISAIFAGGDSSVENWIGSSGPTPTPTPEPTSGLLLLLGVAGLALRRKQK